MGRASRRKWPRRVYRALTARTAEESQRLLALFGRERKFQRALERVRREHEL